MKVNNVSYIGNIFERIGVWISPECDEDTILVGCSSDGFTYERVDCDGATLNLNLSFDGSIRGKMTDPHRIQILEV